MFSRTLRSRVEAGLAEADISINGGRPWDIVLHDERFYLRVISQGALGLVESYMDGWWDCAELAQFFHRLLTAHLDGHDRFTWSSALAYFKARVENRQGKWLAAENVRRHYDLGNDLYRNMLGRWMVYSSTNWEHAHTLDEAGESKLAFVCKRIGLRGGQKILDIGCGWGGMAKYAAQKYGAQVVGITLSEEQAAFARETCSDLPVEIRYQDYRDVTGEFDAIVSLGMFEHVGYKNYRRFMEVVHRCLKPGGVFFLNTIGTNESGYCANSWTEKYIFPGGMLPSMAQIASAADGLFTMEDVRDWAEFYDKTLTSWFEKFNRNWMSLKDRYGERFYRMWKYYLLSSAGAFRSKSILDWQILFST